jgi:hypothetical protein
VLKSPVPINIKNVAKYSEEKDVNEASITTLKLAAKRKRPHRKKPAAGAT